MLIYVIIAIGTLWGIFTLIGIREEDKEIQDMIKSAQPAQKELPAFIQNAIISKDK